MIPIKDYIPKKELCYYCGNPNCNGYFVKGYMHLNCYYREDKEEYKENDK